MILWHFTCQHGHDALGESGDLVVLGDLTDETRLDPPMRWMAGVIWLTDDPTGAGCGLERRSLICNRLGYRYRVTDHGTIPPVRWLDFFGVLPPEHKRFARMLNLAVDAAPGRWWVSTVSMPAVYDPR